MLQYKIGLTSDKIWNQSEFLDFLISNQHKDITLNIGPEAICLTSVGVYDLLDKFTFNQVTINTRNPLEKHSKYNIKYKNNFWFSRVEPINPELHTWNQNKIFYCLFGRPTASRLGIAGHVHKNHNTITHLHFSATTHPDTLDQFELNKLLQYDIDSVEQTGNLIKKLPLLLSNPHLYTEHNGYVYSDPLTTFYKDIFIDVLSESHVLGNTFFPTEKTIRPMLLKKPFIVFTSKNYLDYLRQMGFETFYRFWDESYDGYETKDRYHKILNLIDTLAAKSKSELVDIYNDMKPILDHNYNLLVTQTYNTKITKI
jgi:hypothetical protein